MIARDANIIDVSVVIPSYNSRRTIDSCLKALLKQTSLGRVEIILVDSSNDGTDELVRKNFSKVRLIRLPSPTPQGKARNAGVRVAQGEVVAFIDADCSAAPDWLEKHLAAQRRYPLVGGSIGNSRWYSLIGWAAYFLEFSGYSPSSRQGPANCIISGNFSAKKSILEKHPFPEELWRGEDIAFLGSLAGKYELYYLGSARVDHDHPYRLGEFFRKQKRNGESAAVVWKMIGKHPILVRHRCLSFLTPFWRLPLILFRTLRDTPLWSLPLLLASPLIFAGACCWAWGFYQRAKQGD